MVEVHRIRNTFIWLIIVLQLQFDNIYELINSYSI